MGLGILEDKYLVDVPGTVPLADLHAGNARDGGPACFSMLISSSFILKAWCRLGQGHGIGPATHRQPSRSLELAFMEERFDFHYLCDQQCRDLWVG
jgi:hypothetical protein